MGYYSPSSADKTVVRIEEEGLGAELTNLWQSEFNKVTTTAPEVMVYSANAVAMESTGDLVAFAKVDAPDMGVAAYSTQAESDDDEGGIFDWLGDAWDKTTNFLGNAWDGATGWIAEYADMFVGAIATLAAGALMAMIQYFAGGAHAGELDKEDSEKSVERDGPTKTIRETIVSVITYDVNKAINEKVQKAVFGKTYQDIKDMKEGQEKTTREKIGEALDKVSSFDIVNTVVNKPIQLLALGVTLDSFRKDMEQDKTAITGMSKRLNIKDMIAEKNQENNKATNSPKGITTEKATENSESKPASFTARYYDNGKSFESGQYRQMKVVERNWSVNTRAQILDSLIKADVNKAINVIAGDLILGQDIYTTQAEMNQTAKAYKKEMETRQHNQKVTAQFLNHTLNDLVSEYNALEKIKMDSKEKAHFDKADDAGHKERTNDHDQMLLDTPQNLNEQKETDTILLPQPESAADKEKKDEPMLLELFEPESSDPDFEIVIFDGPVDKSEGEVDFIDIEYEEVVDAEFVEMEDTSFEDTFDSVEDNVEPEDNSTTAEEANQDDSDTASDVDSDEEIHYALEADPDFSNMTGEEYIAYLEDKIEAMEDLIAETKAEMMAEYESQFESYTAGEDVEEKEADMEMSEVIDAEFTVVEETAAEEVQEEGKEETETMSTDMVTETDTSPAIEISETTEETTVEIVQDTEDINRYDSEFVEEVEEKEDDKEHQTDGNRNENEGRASSHESDKHVDMD